MHEYFPEVYGIKTEVTWGTLSQGNKKQKKSTIAETQNAPHPATLKHMHVYTICQYHIDFFASTIKTLKNHPEITKLNRNLPQSGKKELEPETKTEEIKNLLKNYKTLIEKAINDPNKIETPNNAEIEIDKGIIASSGIVFIIFLGITGYPKLNCP